MTRDEQDLLVKNGVRLQALIAAHNLDFLTHILDTYTKIYDDMVQNLTVTHRLTVKQALLIESTRAEIKLLEKANAT